MMRIAFNQFLLLGLVLSCFSQTCWADDIDREPINYSTAPLKDVVTQLQQELDSGDAQLEWDEKHGWLPSLLKLLKIDTSSQLLVFSKTSLQFTKISPHRPRALYFTDDAYIGFVQLGDILEVSAVDPVQGAVFYSLAQEKTEAPKFVRDEGQCLACHHNRRTQKVPGYLVRSVFPESDGNPRLSLGTVSTDQSTDFQERFGGWYVTGQHGAMRHRGNVIAQEDSDRPLDFEDGANLVDLTSRINTRSYLTPHSDLVALMVLEHQAQMHNYITLASYEARRVKHYDLTWNKILERADDFQSDVSQRRIARATEKLLRYLLFSEEFQLTSPIEGTSKFTQKFTSLGPRDSQGRSLRDFDLQTRLFKYPCSYLIYSDSFAALPAVIREHVDRRLVEILSGADESPEFTHLTAFDRQAIREILTETLPGFGKGL
jgi:hypothetical protein